MTLPDPLCGCTAERDCERGTELRHLAQYARKSSYFTLARLMQDDYNDHKRLYEAHRREMR